MNEVRDKVRRSRPLWLATSIALDIAAFLGDWLSGAEVSFSAFYLVSIGIATWFVGRTAGFALSLVSAGGWTLAYFLTGAPYSKPGVLYFNVGMELGIFFTVTLALARVRSGIESERGLAQRLELAYRLLDREMQSVGNLQRSLLPVRNPELPGYAIAVHYSTSARAGGDYYDFLRLDDGRLGILIADASGHGAPAAVLMAMTRVLLQTLPQLSSEPERLLSALNAGLLRTIPAGQFVTACYAVLSAITGELDYAVAGHPPPLLARADGRLEALTTSSGPPLGLFETCEFGSQKAWLYGADTVLLYTDGLIEAMDAEGRMLGIEAVRQRLYECSALPPDDLRDALVADVSHHIGKAPAQDDLTLLVLRACAPGDPPAPAESPIQI